MKNELDANVLCLLAVSDTAPDLTVEIHTGNDPENGAWLPGTVLGTNMSEKTGIDANGFYYIPMGGVQYLRITNSSDDDTLTVVGAFYRSPVFGWNHVIKTDGIIETETEISDTDDGYIEWTREESGYEGSNLNTDDSGNLVQVIDENFDYVPADLSIEDGTLSATTY